MTAVVFEVIVRVAVGSAVRAVPAVRTPVAAAVLTAAVSGRPAITRAAPAQTGERLGDDVGGVRLSSRGGFDGHTMILHAT